LLESFATFASSVAVVFIARVTGGGADMVTTMGVVEVIVAVAVADWVGSATEVAVMVTAPSPVGIVDGARYFTAAPLFDVSGLMVPQGELPQLSVQVTPSPAVSLLNTAVKTVLLYAPEVFT
jgi:hypothetical protein